MPPKLKEPKQKRGRRGNNEGSIYQRASDGLWVGSVTIGYKTNGKPNRKPVYGKSRQEVVKKVSALTSKVFANGYETVYVENSRNFKELMFKWYKLHKELHIAPKTRKKYLDIFRLHFYSEFGKLDVKRIDADMIQSFVNRKSLAGLSMNYIGLMKQLLDQFFSYLLDAKLLAENPVSRAKIPDNGNKYKPSDDMALSEDLRKRVFSAIANNEVLKPIILTFGFTGLRPQELLALKWSDIDFKSGTISINHAINEDMTFDDDGKVLSKKEIIGKTKTELSVRTFIAPQPVLDALAQWKKNSEKYHCEFVFCNMRTGDRISYYGLRSRLQKFLKANHLTGYGITLYTFRHTFATMLLEQIEHAKIVAALMGHSEVRTTLNIYSHVIDKKVYEKSAVILSDEYAKYLV